MGAGRGGGKIYLLLLCILHRKKILPIKTNNNCSEYKVHSAHEIEIGA